MNTRGKTSTRAKPADETRPADPPAAAPAGATANAPPDAPAGPASSDAPRAEPAPGGGGDPAASAETARPRLAVTALADRRRRFGMDFGRAETDLDPEAIGEAGFRALVGDPLLKVELVFRNGERVRITSFPPSDEVQRRIEELSTATATE